MAHDSTRKSAGLTVFAVSADQVSHVRRVCAAHAQDRDDLTLLLDALAIGADWPAAWTGPVIILDPPYTA